MKKAVLCIVENNEQAETVVQKLRTSGFPPGDISVLFPDRRGTHDFAHELSTKAPEGAMAGASAGGILGGGLGLLIGLGALVLPGVGPLVAAGPLLAALSGLGAGALTLGVAGALVGTGIPELEAKRYEGKIKGGNILISVHTESAKERTAAEEIFRAARAHDICSTTESQVPHVELG